LCLLAALGGSNAWFEKKNAAAVPMREAYPKEFFFLEHGLWKGIEPEFILVPKFLVKKLISCFIFHYLSTWFGQYIIWEALCYIISSWILNMQRQYLCHMWRASGKRLISHNFFNWTSFHSIFYYLCIWMKWYLSAVYLAYECSDT
jgi:hypothetical protein